MADVTPDPPKKVSRRILELCEQGVSRFDASDPAQIPALVLWVAGEVCNSRKFTQAIEESSIIKIVESLVRDAVNEVPDNLLAEIRGLAREFRYQFRFGDRTGIAKNPRCTIV